MDFAWEELSEAERRQAYADWEAGKGLIGGDPRHASRFDAAARVGPGPALFSRVGAGR